MKLIVEQVEDINVLTEEKNGESSLFIEGRFLVADEVNRNNRLYEMNTLRKAVKNYTENFINQKRSVGCLNHEATPSVGLDKVSHLITSLKENGNIFIGKAKILESLPMGKIAAGLIKEGVRLGVSSRAMGSLERTNEGYSKVGKDLVISTIDIVSDPSGPGCFVESLYEDVDWIYNSVTNEWVIDNAKRKIESLVESRQLTETKKLEIFNDFLNSL
jgi:hypothetical protein